MAKFLIQGLSTLAPKQEQDRAAQKPIWPLVASHTRTLRPTGSAAAVTPVPTDRGDPTLHSTRPSATHSQAATSPLPAVIDSARAACGSALHRRWPQRIPTLFCSPARRLAQRHPMREASPHLHAGPTRPVPRVTWARHASRRGNYFPPPPPRPCSSLSSAAHALC